MTPTIYMDTRIFRGEDREVVIKGAAIVTSYRYTYEFMYMGTKMFHEKYLFTKILAYVIKDMNKHIRVIKTRKQRPNPMELEFNLKRYGDIDWLMSYKKQMKHKGYKYGDEIIDHYTALHLYFRKGSHIEMFYHTPRYTSPGLLPKDMEILKRCRLLRTSMRKVKEFAEEQFKSEDQHLMFVRRKDNLYGDKATYQKEARKARS